MCNKSLSETILENDTMLKFLYSTEIARNLAANWSHQEVTTPHLLYANL